MANPFIEITDTKSLDRFLAQSGNGQAVILKHSNSCGISSLAYSEMARLEQPVGLVTVQRARGVSDEIERRWEVTHESPQVLIIRDGNVVWTASHGRVRVEAVEAALRESVRR